MSCDNSPINEIVKYNLHVLTTAAFINVHNTNVFYIYILFLILVLLIPNYKKSASNCMELSFIDYLIYDEF